MLGIYYSILRVGVPKLNTYLTIFLSRTESFTNQPISLKPRIGPTIISYFSLKKLCHMLYKNYQSNN